jgi:hypothetical protein
LELTADWSGRGDKIAIPDEYNVRADGDESAKRTFTQTVSEHPDLFEPGTHRLHAWNDAEGVTVSGNTASVATITTNRAAPTMLESLPGWFFSCALDAEIESDTRHEVSVHMRQQVRELTLIIEPTAEGSDRIERVSARLSGVAGTLDIDTGEHGMPSDIYLDFTKITQGPNAGRWVVTARVLGIVGTEQRLTGTIMFSASYGTPDIRFESDMSSTLVGFNVDKPATLALWGKTLRTSSEAATIPVWREIAGWNDIADELDLN